MKQTILRYKDLVEGNYYTEDVPDSSYSRNKLIFLFSENIEKNKFINLGGEASIGKCSGIYDKDESRIYRESTEEEIQELNKLFKIETNFYTI